MARGFRNWNSKMDGWLVRQRGIEATRETNEHVLAQHRRWFGERAFSVINGKYILGCRLNMEGRHDEALDLFEQVLVQRSERYGPDHRKTREVRGALGATLSKLGRNEEARDVLNPLVVDCVRICGEGDEETQRNRLWLASVLCDLGKYHLAQAELERLFEGARGGWLNPDARDRAEQFWRIVTSDDMPK